MVSRAHRPADGLSASSLVSGDVGFCLSLRRAGPRADLYLRIAQCGEIVEADQFCVVRKRIIELLNVKAVLVVENGEEGRRRHKHQIYRPLARECLTGLWLVFILPTMSNTRRINRRQFLKFVLGASAGGAAAAMGGSVYSALIEPQWLSIERIEVPLARLPRELDGFTIAQLSDLHLGPYIGVAEIRSAVEATNQLQPDAIVLTGDYVTREADLMDECAHELSALTAPDGVYAVLGNHDHWSSPEHIARALEENSIPVLMNDAVPIDRNGARMWIAGVDDVWQRRADLDAALRRVPTTEATVLLAHEPDYAELAKRYPIDLQLSGHSHGGQVRLPFYGAPILPYLGKKYPIGLERADALTVYTNRGIGVVSPPVRFNCRPEITLLTLRQQIASQNG